MRATSGRRRAVWAGRILLALAALIVAAEARAERLPEWLEFRPGDGSAGPLAHEALAKLQKERAGWLDAGYGYVEVAWRTQITIEREPRVRMHRTEMRGFVSDVGGQQGGNFEIHVKTSRARISILRAYLLRSDGSIEEVDARSIQVTDAQAPELFSDEKRVTIPMRGVVPGAIGVLEYEEVRDLDADPMPWSLYTFLQMAVPIASQEITVVNERDPSWLDWKTNDAELKCTSRAADRIVCERAATDAIASDPAINSYADLVPHLIFAERVDWNALAERVGGLVEGKLDSSPAIAAEVERIRSGFADDGARAEELYRVVSNQVRYLGFEHGDSAVVPHSASETWAKRFGDCKDKVTLFVAMARALGIDARPVLASTFHFDAERLLLPAGSYFDHMIVCSDALRVDDGCVDVTLASSPAALPFQLQGAVALDLGTGPTTRRPRLHELPRREILWEVAIEREVELGCDGGARETVARSNGGALGDIIRSALAAATPADRTQHLNDEFNSALPAIADRPVQQISGLADPSRPYSVRYSTEQAAAFQARGRESYFDFDAWLTFHLRSMIIENKHHPYDLPGLELASTTRYSLCERGRIETLGPTLRFEREWGEIRRFYTLDGDDLVVESKVRIPSRRLTPAQAADMRLSIGRVLEQSAIRFDYAID